jgi:hypothetical protein
MARVDRVVRLTSGLAVLLLVATQEKVCPWLDEVPPEVQRAAARSEPDKSADDPEAPEVPLPSLASTLPDIVAPRWPARAAASAIPGFVRGKAVPGTADRSGDYDTSVAPPWELSVAVPFPWQVPLRSSATADSVSVAGRVLLVLPGALLTSISPTGPPAA